jgi:hypothetical protein
MKKFLFITAVIMLVNLKAQQTICFVKLKDGSAYRGTTSLANVLINTKYGNLNVPVSLKRSMRRIR